MNMEPMEITAQVITRMRITVGALVMGIISLAVIIIGVEMQMPAMAPDMTFIDYMGVAMLVLAVGMQFVLLPVVDASARKRIDLNRNDVAPVGGRMGQSSDHRLRAHRRSGVHESHRRIDRRPASRLDWWTGGSRIDDRLSLANRKQIA
jgi:hypothetical protein